MSKLRILFQKQQHNDKLALRYILKAMCFGPLPQGLFIREKNVIYSAVRFLVLLRAISEGKRSAKVELRGMAI